LISRILFNFIIQVDYSNVLTKKNKAKYLDSVKSSINLQEFDVHSFITQRNRIKKIDLINIGLKRMELQLFKILFDNRCSLSRSQFCPSELYQLCCADQTICSNSIDLCLDFLYHFQRCFLLRNQNTRKYLEENKTYICMNMQTLRRHKPCLPTTYQMKTLIHVKSCSDIMR
jgi:hypothetical protein